MNNAKTTMSKKTIGLLLLLVAAIFLVLTFVTAFTGGSSPAQAKNSVVLIYTEFADSSYYYSATGTGFFVGEKGKNPEYIVTNAHVVEGYDTYGGYIGVVFSAVTNDIVVPRIVSINYEKDIAILKIPEPTTKRVPIALRLSADVEPGETVIALGFPGISTDASSYTTWDTDDITMTRGIISKKTSLAWANIQAYEMDVAIHSGNSGGPLVDEKGNAVGINTFGIEATEQMNFAIIIDELVPILRNNNVPYYTSGGIPILTLVFLVATLAAAAAGLVFIARQRRTPVPVAGQPVPGFVPGMQPAPAQQGPAAPRAPMLRGVSGRYAGERFELKGGKILMGRDAGRCNLVYDAGIAGISACHCCLSYDAVSGQFVLEDLGSSYGTFLGSGQKLAPNVPIRLSAGDTFYLANAENKFIVGLE